MQESEGKPSRKSDEIASTPTRGQTAEVTPRLNATEREQANAKKAKHNKKNGLENYFGTGVRMPPPSLAGTPIDAAGKQRGESTRRERINARLNRGRTPTHATKGRTIRGGKARVPQGSPLRNPLPRVRMTNTLEGAKRRDRTTMHPLLTDPAEANQQTLSR